MRCSDRILSRVILLEFVLSAVVMKPIASSSNTNFQEKLEEKQAFNAQALLDSAVPGTKSWGVSMTTEDDPATRVGLVLHGWKLNSSLAVVSLLLGALFPIP